MSTKACYIPYLQDKHNFFCRLCSYCCANTFILRWKHRSWLGFSNCPCNAHNDSAGSWLSRARAVGLWPGWESGLRNDGGVRWGVRRGVAGGGERTWATAPGEAAQSDLLCSQSKLPLFSQRLWCVPREGGGGGGGPGSWKWAGSANKQRGGARTRHANTFTYETRKKNLTWLSSGVESRTNGALIEVRDTFTPSGGNWWRRPGWKRGGVQDVADSWSYYSR